MNASDFIKFDYLILTIIRIFFHNLKVSMMKLRLQQILPLILLISTMFTPYNMKADNTNSLPPLVKLWIGGIGNWNVKANWSPSGIPDSKNIVSIKGANSKVTLPKGVVVSAMQVILEDGCSLVLNNKSRLSINGSIDDGLVMSNGAIFTNRGVLEVDNVGKNAISTVGIVNPSSFTNEGTIKIGNNSTEDSPIGGKGIYLTNTAFTNTLAGKIFIDNVANDFAILTTSTSIFTNDGEVAFGTYLSVYYGIDNEGPGDFFNNGLLTFTNVSEEGVTLRTKIVNSGTIGVSPFAKLILNGSISNEELGFITIDGEIVNNGTIENKFRSFLTIFPNGKLMDYGVFTNQSFIRNYGTLHIAAGKTLEMSSVALDVLFPDETPPATFYNEITGVVNVEGIFNIKDRSVFNTNGTTQGDFKIVEIVEFNSDVNSRIAPGKKLDDPATNDIGMLTITGNLDLMSGTLDIEANGAESSSLYDYITVQGRVTLGANSKLKVAHGGNYMPKTGDEITVIKSTGGSVNGTFVAPNFDIPAGWKIRYEYPSAGDVTLVFTQILPVELLSFNAVNKGIPNVLTWETASEITNSGFEVQRKGEQGEWEVMGFVKGNGAASVYKFTDSNPLSISYYRLRQVDHDGKSEMSKVVSVVKERQFEVQVYPNPTPGKLKIQLAKEADADITVYNIVGQAVMANEKISTAGEIDLSPLTRGTYIVEIKSAGAIVRQKVVKQ
jgi:Secretion system C-terminal sorting domain